DRLVAQVAAALHGLLEPAGLRVRALRVGQRARALPALLAAARGLRVVVVLRSGARLAVRRVARALAAALLAAALLAARLTAGRRLVLRVILVRAGVAVRAALLALAPA